VRIRYFHTEGFRLSAIYTLVFALSILAIGAIVLLISDRAMRDQIVESARTDVLAMQRGYDQKGMVEVLEVIDQLRGEPGASDSFLVQQSGRRLAGNLSAMPPRTGIIELPANDRHGVILGVGVFLAPNLYAFSGSGLDHLQKTRSEILGTLLWVFLGVLLLAAAGGVLISRSFLSRTDAMARACRSIMDGEMKARLPVRGTRDELDRLAATVNEMLDRIAMLVDNLSQVTNDVAHDLRTPVTHLRQRLEKGKRDSADAQKSEAAFQAAIQKTDEILSMFAALLRIVQIEGGSRRNAFAKVNLKALLEQLREMFTPVADAADHLLILEALDDGVINGDRALLLQLFSNLIENAILHTPGGTRIWLRLSRTAINTVAVSVADDGPGVPVEEQQKLFRRLYRREASRTTPGYGLGMSVAAAIAELHGAKIAIDPAVQGLTVRVTFDAASAGPQ
jgi:signal transduction histidine kinase